jgi:predicted PurR-regulated permease PerM
MSTAEFAFRTLIVLALALIPFLIWRLFDVVMIGIGAILVAEALQLGAEPFRRLKVPRAAALVLSGILIIGMVATAAYLFGSKIGFELQDVVQRAEAAQGTIKNSLDGSGFGRMIMSHFSAPNFSVAGVIGNFFDTSTALFEALVVTLFGGVYLAGQPRLYRAGLIRLFPWSRRGQVAETIDALARALRLWLLGQLIQMALIGILTTIAVMAVGLPSPFALGLIAAVAEFIPYLGPIIAAIPALLVAATAGMHAVLWTLLAYVLIHQIEGELIAPLVQRQMVYIPPLVMLMSVATLTYLFGWLAIIVAAPIAVLIYVAINKIYVRDVLGDKARLPGEVRETRA